jgi:S1-C subfamily serine protease
MTDQPTSSTSQSSPQNSALQLSQHLAAIVATTARSVVAVHGDGRRPSSGLIWQVGLVVAANETVTRDEDIWFVLPDGRRVAATLAGRDPTTDVALLRYADEAASADAASTPVPLSTVPFASNLAAGHLALAVGRAHGETVAAHGIVALAGPAWRSSEGGLIDARLRFALNLPRTAEGGALIAIDGSLIGMAVFGPRRSVLAIPAATIARAAQSIKDKGHIPRGYLGVSLQRVPVAGDGDRPRAAAMVVTVDPAGPAKAAGILQGDIIVALGGTPVSGLRSLYQQLGPDAVGQRKAVEIIRAGAPTTVEVTIEPRP